MSLDEIFPEAAAQAKELHFHAPIKRPRQKPDEVQKMRRCTRCGHMIGRHEILRKSPKLQIGVCFVYKCTCRGAKTIKQDD